MTKETYQRKIKKACQDAGTYRPFFDETIKTLSQMLETRDKALEQYEKTGGKPVVAHTNKAGATNIVKNPALTVVADINRDALAYWRDLGLTPAGLRRINEKAMEQKKGKDLAGLVADLLGE